MRSAALCSAASSSDLGTSLAWMGASPASISTMSWTSRSLAACAALTWTSACSLKTKANIARCQECSAEFSRREPLTNDDCRTTDFSRSSSSRKSSWSFSAFFPCCAHHSLPCIAWLPRQRAPGLMSLVGTDRPFTAMQRFRPVIELFASYWRGSRDACSTDDAAIAAAIRAKFRHAKVQAGTSFCGPYCRTMHSRPRKGISWSLHHASRRTFSG
jgi:hypothetical protein